MVKKNVSYSYTLTILAILMITVLSFKVESMPVLKSKVNLNFESPEDTIKDSSKIGRLLNQDFRRSEKGDGKGEGSLNERSNVYGRRMPGKRSNLNEEKHEQGSEFANENALVVDNDITIERRKRHASRRGEDKIVSDRKIKEKDNEKGNGQHKESDNKNGDDKSDKEINNGNGQPGKHGGIVSDKKVRDEDNEKEPGQDKESEREIGDINDNNQNINGKNKHNWRRAMAKLKILGGKGRSNIR